MEWIKLDRSSRFKSLQGNGAGSNGEELLRLQFILGVDTQQLGLLIQNHGMEVVGQKYQI